MGKTTKDSRSNQRNGVFLLDGLTIVTHYFLFWCHRKKHFGFGSLGVGGVYVVEKVSIFQPLFKHKCYKSFIFSQNLAQCKQIAD